VSQDQGEGLPTTMLELGSEIDSVLDALRDFVRSEVLPIEEKLGDVLADDRKIFDETGRYRTEILDARREIRTRSATAGYLQMFVPEELGGGGLGALAHYAVWEDLYHHWSMKHWLAFDSVSHGATGPSHLFAEASAAVQAEVLPLLMSGERTICFAMSEPDAGSDLWQMRTTARREGDEWVINGVKQWMTNGPYADYAIVFAVTDQDAFAKHAGGISAFLVSADDPGYRVDSVIKLFGHVGSNEAILSFTDVRVGDDAVMGPLGDGLRFGLSGTSVGRLYNAGRSVGLSRWALEQALDYTAARRAFGSALLDYQGVSFPLATNAIEIHAAHLMGVNAARIIDAGGSGAMEAAMAKAFSTEVAGRVIDQAVQALGGMGLTNEVHLTQAWQELRAVRIADGSAEMLRRMIVGQLHKGRRDL
jgi:acyl-CoA dehydrogenase